MTEKRITIPLSTARSIQVRRLVDAKLVARKDIIAAYEAILDEPDPLKIVATASLKKLEQLGYKGDAQD